MKNYILVIRHAFAFLVCVMSFTLVKGQSKDSLRTAKDYKNIIKLNLTSNILYSLPLIEYERIVKKNQSFSVQVGIVSLPFGKSSTADSLYFQSDVKKSGYSLTADYRFYLASENKDPAPHGVYIGPYFGYYQFDNERTMRIGSSPSPIVLNSKIQVVSIGVQLGYQFVLGKQKRWTLDCIVVGPSLTNYNANLKLTGNVDPAKIDEALKKILDGVANRFPIVGDLLKERTADFKGSADSWTAGFRYSMHLGFRF
jgi:hypothetical protein